MSLAAAMKLARKKMDRYYSLTDSSNVYRIAMVLHPGMKLEYFRNQKWEDEWIDEAECLVREEYAAKYETVAEELTEESNDMPKKNLSTKINDGFASFGNLSVTTSPCPNEIQEYLSHTVENVKHPLKWWVENKYIYPKLYRMPHPPLSNEYFRKATICFRFLVTPSRPLQFMHSSALGHGLIVVLLFWRM